ncbi:transglutaminase domain-containing protein [Verrucomicrobiaceae bacterium N1E253]|uniref:Transglutaminase domain-containing protein n=2 Tax=Oceaniferula marina TaxID=2748318 RepID=A0A851GQ31_9BACT|nr:transglutaminase domain-containing protein [Oceaniferula marina]
MQVMRAMRLRWTGAAVGVAVMVGVLIPGMPLIADERVETAYSRELDAKLEQAGENRAELEKALDEVPKAQRKGMHFLIAYMPDSDARSLNAAYLLNNVAWAYKARENFTWAKQVPEDVFFNDVLPYASLNERRDDWRQDFYKRFSKYVKDAKTQEEALMAVNRNILKELKVEYNTKRKKPDQSPYESMEQGMASCSGLSILLNNAFRSVGIPSRVAGIPAWTTKRGNHNWVEVWTPVDKAWHFTEYYPDAKGLDHGWLLADAAQANPKSFYHSIYASSWKSTGLHFPMVWNMKNKEVPAVNVTERYVALGGENAVGENDCELRIHRMVGGKRVAIPVVVLQGDLKIAEGVSPKPSDDMNRFYTVVVRKGQIYQLMWKDEVSGAMQRQTVTTPKDKTWLEVKLGG